MATTSVKLDSGETVLVDEADAYLVRSYKWRMAGDPPQLSRSTSKGRVLLAAVIAGATHVDRVHHINNNALDNRRENLRVWRQLAIPEVWEAQDVRG